MKKIKYMIVVAVLGMTSTAAAQNLQSGYFVDGFLYRHEMNPAFANEQNYVAMPALGNLNLNLNSNLRVDDVLYRVDTPKGRRTALFLHPSVSAGEFLANINEKNRVSQNLKLQILGGGFSAWGGYNTVAINARENLYVKFPGELLELAKNGLENKTYDLSNINAHADAYVEMAFGHSRQFTDQLRLGAKLKFLFGIANVDASVERAELQLNNDYYTGVTNATIHASMNDLKYEMKKKMRGMSGSEVEHTYVGGVDDSKFGVSGFGVAVDLGGEYKIDDNWKVSAALLDFGFIGYSHDFQASTRGDQEVNTSRYKDGEERLFGFDDDADNDNSFDNAMDRLTNDLAYLYELQDDGDKGGRTKWLGATLNLGGEYKPDFYDKITFSLLNSTRIAGKYSWTDFRIGANWAPVKAFSASVNLAFGTYGTSFGWLLNAHPNGFNFFIGMDHMMGKLAKQGLPLSGRAQFSMGINFPFGGKTKAKAPKAPIDPQPEQSKN